MYGFSSTLVSIIILKCWNFENLKTFVRKHVKQSEATVQTFYLLYYKNYSQLIFCCCFLQDDRVSKVANTYTFKG